MTDNFENDFYDEHTSSEESTSKPDEASTNDIFSSSDSSAETASESSYEWNSGSSTGSTSGSTSGSEYHYSYVNGNNQTASHNPNNYENAYSTAQQSAYSSNNSTYSSAGNSSYSDNSGSYNGYYSNNGYQNQTNNYSGSAQQFNNSYNGQNHYGGYSNQAYNSQYNQAQPYSVQGHKKPQKAKVKKPKKPVSRGFIAAMLVITVVASAALGFGGGYISSNLGKSSEGALNINKVDSSSSPSTITTGSETASSVVKKAADSVVEITTESVVTGQFQRQYISQGAGSGVIVSEDGYIITNNHVIEGANSITVTLRDGQTSYDATLVGTDADNDIALIKVDATGLPPATFGDSSTLAVGDYVVAIGNPLGQLGGTVTDGIISALAREVTIEDQNMTLLQTNAQINPGNSGGGLFNANGELIGIVNAKESATEVEGIGFAIPVNNVLDIINDLKNYGYVTGKIDLGMEFVDINSTETAFYYGVNKAGCYVLSVTSGSNADKAGFKSGDLVNSVDGTEVSSSAEIEKLIDDKEVGDTVTFNVTRNGKSADLTLTLAEYVPSSKLSGQDTTYSGYNDSGDSIWSEMFDWY